MIVLLGIGILCSLFGWGCEPSGVLTQHGIVGNTNLTIDESYKVDDSNFELGTEETITTIESPWESMNGNYTVSKVFNVTVCRGPDLSEDDCRKQHDMREKLQLEYNQKESDCKAYEKLKNEEIRDSRLDVPFFVKICVPISNEERLEIKIMELEIRIAKLENQSDSNQFKPSVSEVTKE